MTTSDPWDVIERAIAAGVVFAPEVANLTVPQARSLCDRLVVGVRAAWEDVFPTIRAEDTATGSGAVRFRAARLADNESRVTPRSDGTSG